MNIYNRILEQAINGLVKGFIAENIEILASLQASGKSFDLRNRIIKHLDSFPTPFRIAITITILWVEFTNIVSIFTMTRLSKLPTNKITHYLDHAIESGFPLRRWAFLGVKFICLSQIYSDHGVLSSLGYEQAHTERNTGQCRQ